MNEIENKIEAGSCVTLNSGGQKMTVEFLDGKECQCCWMDENKNKKEARFYIVTLKLPESKSKPFEKVEKVRHIRV